MRVYVIRHGESETNRAKRWTGWVDAHLTDKGKEDVLRRQGPWSLAAKPKVSTTWPFIEKNVANLVDQRSPTSDI